MPTAAAPSFAPRLAAALLAASLACVPAGARAADTYAIDPVHTRIAVDIGHAGFSRAIGTVSGTTGTLMFDPDDWRSARVDVRIPLARLDFGDEKWNRATLARNLLDAAAHPEARFVSTRVEPLHDRRAHVFGTLTLRGVSREVRLDATFNALKRHPLPPFRRTLGWSATAQLSRADFGITAWPSVIGDDVGLRIELEATRSRAGSDDAGTTGSATPADAATPDDTGAGPASDPSPTPDPEPVP